MRKIKKFILLLILMFVLIANNKVFAEENRDGWKFIVKANDSYSATDTLKNLRLAQTCDEETLMDGKIAPGTRGSFSIEIETDELGADYNIIFDNFSSSFPKNLIFTVDNEIYDIKSGFHNRLNGEGKAIHKVDWYWDFDGEDEFDSEVNTEITFDITVKAEQVNERAVPEVAREVLPKTGF